VRQGDDQATTRRLLSVHDAAEALDLTVEAVRSRLKRGTLQREKGDDGTVYVVVEDRQGGDRAQPGGDRAGDGSDDRARQDGDRSALLAAKDQTIRTLEQQLEAEREANRENRRIIAGLVQRVPELEPAPETSSAPRESPETASEEPNSTHAPPEPQELTQRRSWWRQFFGLE
jgi:hypothetical protein